MTASTDTVKTSAELTAKMNSDPALRLYWRMGNRPAAPGMYSLSDQTRVYAKAVSGLGESLQVVRGSWSYRVYRLTRSRVAA
jgi:hypothetical protein